MRTVILLAGPSGSGKSRLARVTGAPQLRLDDFYKADTDEGLPHTPAGLVDWDHVASWNAIAAARALEELISQGTTEAPRYVIAENRAVGTHLVDVRDAPVVIAEGIFAPDLLATCREHGVEVTPVWLDRSRHANFSRRLRRDLKHHRKPPAVLVRRGLQLWREERAKRHRAVGLGFRPLSMTEAISLVQQLQAG